MIYEKNSDGDRRKKPCCCCVCKEVSLCTPRNDFYTTPVTGDRLVCELCFSANRHLDPELAKCL